MKRSHLFVATILFFSTATVFSQQKLESEKRVKPGDVPDKALAFIAPAQTKCKPKWYFEENLVGNSYEAKFRLNGKKYSVEFDTTGLLQDIEIVVTWQEVPLSAKDNISNKLSALFDNYKIRKVQAQYQGEITRLSPLITGLDQVDINPNYEIVLRGKSGKQVKLYEITFSNTGDLLSQEEIIFKNSDILEY